MAPKKRKSIQAEVDTASVPKRGRGRPANSAPVPRKGRGRPPKASSGPSAASSPPKRKANSVQQTASSSRPKRASPATKEVPKITRSSKNGGVSKPVAKTTKAAKTGNSTTTVKPKKATKSATKSRGSTNNPVKERRDSNVSVEIPQVYTSTADPVVESEGDEDPEGPAYWLMKAEPESRIEKGKDVKFSIDDLKNAIEPEAWDGVRNASARNNMRAMMKGDMAFFYHSNCKFPGIVGTMEIVEEHSVDESAFDPQHPYYDPKSTRDNPKWCCVKVAYRQKFPEIIKLKGLQRFAKDGGVLANMQTLRMSRLSVSKVTKKEWDFIMSLVGSEDDGATGAAS